MADLSVYGKVNNLSDLMFQRERERFNRRMMERQVSAREQAIAGGGNDPAVLKINNAISEALKNGDYETANRLERLAKTHDKGIDFYGTPSWQDAMKMPPQEAM